MNKGLVAVVLLLAAPVLADEHVSYEYATVIEADPVVETVRVSVPREECWQERVVYRDYDHDRGGNGVGTVLGAVVGGALGNEVGHKKRNKQVGTVVGAVVGATVGTAIARSAREARSRGGEEVCRVYHDYRDETHVIGYDVRYRYNNRTYTTRMDRDPGDTIKLRLALTPVSHFSD